MFINTNRANLCQNSVFAKLSGCQNEVFEKKLRIFCFCLFYVGQRNRKKTKWEKAKSLIKIVFFKGGHPKIRKWIFAKIA